MEIKVIGQDSSFTSHIMEFDEQQFHDIVKYVNELNVDCYDIYEDLYKSKRSMFPSITEKNILDNRIDNLKKINPLLETEKQGNDYEWIYINRREKGEDAFRYYFGINPVNLYKLVEKMTEKFANKGIPVSFKYQQEGKKNVVDRIILYTNSLHKEEVEKTLSEIYNENRELFFDSERPLPWLYESNIPNVYVSPESRNHEKSYGENFSSALMDAKKIFHYLYQEDKVKNQEQLEVLKKIVLSTMLRNGCFLTKDGRRIITEEQGIKTFYDKEKNELRNVFEYKNGDYYEAKYDFTIEGKKAFLNNFYSVKNVVNQLGVEVRRLTRQEKNKEIYNYLYPQTANNMHK